MTKQCDLISSIQKQQFVEEGYCVVPNLFSTGEIQEIESFFEDFKICGPRIFEGGTSYAESDKTKQQVRAMQPHRYDQRPKRWVTQPRIAAVLQELLGRPALVAQTMYYFKPPGGRGQGMHQDNFYLLAQPHTCIAAWTAIDDSDEENGCLYVVPGSHRSGILCPEKDAKTWMSYGDSHIGQFPRDTKPVPVAVPRGSTMFFGGQLIHGSGPNRTANRYRRSFIGHYVDDVSDHLAAFYHPVLNMAGEEVTQIQVASGGGPCGDGWHGGVH